MNTGKPPNAKAQRRGGCWPRPLRRLVSRTAFKLFNRFLENAWIVIRIALFELSINDSELVKNGGDTVRGPQVEDRGDVFPFDNMLRNLCPLMIGNKAARKSMASFPLRFGVSGLS
ncbi:MAG: hypothetical protein ACRERE_02270 [Candidatus Entotheonellia bacterium]